MSKETRRLYLTLDLDDWELLANLAQRGGIRQQDLASRLLVVAMGHVWQQLLVEGFDANGDDLVVLFPKPSHKPTE